MASRESKGGVVLTRLGLLFFVVSLCNCSKLTRLKALDGSRETLVRTKSQTETVHLYNGRLLIGQSSFNHAKLNGTNSPKPVLDAETDYQSDMGWQTKQQEKSDWQKRAMESLLKMESKVECSQDSMKLHVHDATSSPASLILVDRGNGSPLPLTKLPSKCGYTIRSTQKDLVLQAPYDGCFVIIQENYYVLPLLWLGLPVRMSCPLMGQVSQNPPMVTCHAEGMVVKTEWTSSASKIKVNVNGNWESLLMAVHRCAFGIVEHPEGVVISVRYEPCIVKEDGMYTIKLAADAEAESKVSCPPLAVQLKLSESQVGGSGLESEILSKWVYPFPTQNPLMLHTHPMESQANSYSQNSQIPSKPNQGLNPGQFHYYNFQSFPDAYLKYSETTPTKRPQSPTTVTTVTQSPDHAGPFYPQLPHPTMPPVTKLPPDQFLNKYVLRLDPFQGPDLPLSYPKVEGQKFHSFYYTDGLSQLSNLYPLYLEKLPEKPGQSHSMSEKGQGEQLPVHLICSEEMAASLPSGPSRLSWLGMFQGEVNQAFQLVCTQMEPASKPTNVFQSSRPEAPNRQVNEVFNLLCTLQGSHLQHLKSSQGRIYYSFYLFCNQQKQASKPAKFTFGQQEPTKGHLFQAFYPLYFQSPQKPTGVTRPPQSVTPQAQVYPHLYPFFPQLKPHQKPAVTSPPQPATPPGPVFQGSFPFYPQPNPTQKPAVTRPPLPATPQAPVYQGLFPFYPRPKPTLKPAVTSPPQPATPQAPVYQGLFPFYPRPKPTQKPAVTRPPQPATQAQEYHGSFPFYPQSKPTQKPAVDSQPATPQAQVYRGLFPFHPRPKPTQKPAVNPPPQQATAKVYPPFFYFYTQTNAAQKPAVAQTPQPATSQSNVYKHFFDFYLKPNPPTTPTTVAQPLQFQLPTGHVSQPLYYKKTQSKPTSSPTEDQSLQLKKNMYQEQQKCLYSQVRAENRAANMPNKPTLGQVYGPCQSRLLAVDGGEGASMGNLMQYSQLPIARLPQAQNEYLNVFHSQQPQSVQQSSGTSTQKLSALASEQKLDTLRTKHGNRVFCPHYCQSELSNCCLQLAFHQHLHISVPAEAKTEPQFYSSFSPASYLGFSQGVETAEVPQKLSSAAVLQAVRTSASAQISSQSQTPSATINFFKPHDGVATSRDSLGPIVNQEQFYPYFGTEFQNPYWAHVAQKGVQQNLEQFKTENRNDPSKLWALGNEQARPVVQYEPFNVHFTEQMLQSRPDLMSYLGQDGPQMEQQSEPDVEQESVQKSEYKRSTDHFKSAIDRFSFPYNMPGDSFKSNNSVGLNSPQEMLSAMSSKNLTKLHKGKNLLSEPKSVILLQNGPPSREPNRLRDSYASFRELAYGANSKALKLLRNADPHTLGSLQAKGQKLAGLGGGTSSQQPGNINQMQRGDDESSFFNLVQENSNPVGVYQDQSFSVESLKPEILKSFENLWKPPLSDFSRFLAIVPGKAEEKGFVSDQLAKGMKEPVMAKRNPKEMSFLQ